MHLRPGGRAREDGAVALLIAIAMVGLCVAAAMVVDLGILRVDRQTDKSAEDQAAVAGVNGLVPDLTNPVIHPFSGVCQALNYLKANSPALQSYDSSTVQWQNGFGASIAGDGCSATYAAMTCTPDSPATWARWTGVTTDGLSRVTIQSGYKLDSSNPLTAGNIVSTTGGTFSEDSLPGYAGDADSADPSYGGGCDQLAVFITKVRNATLGSPAASKIGTRTRSVARVHITPPSSPFALLILNRTDCLALSNTSNGVIDVTGYKVHPGMIHVDSDGTGAQCGSKPIIQGAKADGVVAHEAPDTGDPGRITTVATSNQSDGLANVWAGPAPGTAPSSAAQMTRQVLDNIYITGIRSAVSAASTYLAMNQTDAAAAGFTVHNCPNNDTWTEAKIYVKCNNVNKNVSMPNATDVIFNGQVGADSVLMPKATRVYIVGGTSPAGVSVGSAFEVNNQATGQACPLATDAGYGRGQIFIKDGDFKAIGGSVRLCSTTLVLEGGDQAKACVPATSPTYYADGKVCPTGGLSSTGNGVLSLGGGTTIDWTAPDQVDDEVQATTTDHFNLEDLALWSEPSGTYTLGGGGSMHLMGVFAAPNGDLKLNGGPTNSVKNSQYVAKTLATTGNGTITLTPLPSLPVGPFTTSFDLVR
jgi:Flp pilus assembly protein TadG